MTDDERKLEEYLRESGFDCTQTSDTIYDTWFEARMDTILSMMHFQVRQERERCAAICDSIAGGYGVSGMDLAAGSAAENCAQAIRNGDNE